MGIVHLGKTVVSGMSTLKTVLATGAVVLAAGFIMQIAQTSSAGKAETEKVKTAYQASVTSVMVVNNAKSDSIFGVPDVVTTPLPHKKNLQTVSAVDSFYPERDAPAMGTIQATPIENCPTQLTAVPDVAALVDLEVAAPCHRNAFFVIRHMEMAFSGQTDSDGNASMRAPALASEASFSISFANVEVATTALTVADVGLYDRAVLQWRGKDNLQLHALEFGAKIGDPGHIWSASTTSAELAMKGQRGFITRLGTTEADIPYLAEIYTFPSGLLNRDGAISLAVGAVVTQSNCGREVDAEAIQTNSGSMVVVRDLKIPMPGCDALGKSILLPNMFQDMTLAAR